MKELIIKGTDKYIEYLEKHLHQEHRETKGKTKIKKINENILKSDDLDIYLE